MKLKSLQNENLVNLKYLSVICFGLMHISVSAEDSIEEKIRETERLIAQKQQKLGINTGSNGGVPENSLNSNNLNTNNLNDNSVQNLDGANDNESNFQNEADTATQFEEYKPIANDTTKQTDSSKNKESKATINNTQNSVNTTKNTETKSPTQNSSQSVQSGNDPNKQNNTETEVEKAKPKPKPPPKTPEQLLAKVAPPYDFNTDNPTKFMQKVNSAKWYKGMRINPYTTVRIQVLLDWNHSSPGPIDTGWGMNSRKAIRAFEKKHGLKVDGKMDSKVWRLLNQGKNSTLPALVSYTITKEDVRTRFRKTPKGYEAKARDWELSYNNIYEMFGERFHMSQALLKHLNKGIKFRAGKTITVVNVGRHNKTPVDKVVVDKKRNILYAYNGNTVVATYPTTIGARTPKAGRTYSMVGKVYMPTYKAETPKKRYILPPGPNNPVGVAWMALSKPTFGIHGSPQPEGISRQRSHGCVRLTNWDASELFATIKKGAKVSFK